MKKLLLILVLAFIGFSTQAQQINFPEGNILVYSDTNNLAGGDVLIRSVYAFVPQKTSDTTYEYQYKKVYLLNGYQLTVPGGDYVSYEAASDETLLIGGVQRTYDWAYDQVLTINVANWNVASWQTYLQKIN